MQENIIASYAWRQADNFGDGPLHDLLIPKLFPHIKPITKSVVPQRIFMANGSILGHRRHFSKAWQDIPWLIFGAGFQYGNLDLPKNSVIYALRGRHTKKLCEASENSIVIHDQVAYSDPAILLPLYYPKEEILREEKPQADNAGNQVLTVMKWDWAGKETESITTARTAGDPLGWLRRIWRSQKVVTDSLHAAIVADAYGIPWFPLRWEFKWRDHFEQFGFLEKPQDFVLSDRRLIADMQSTLELAKMHLQQALAALF